MNKKFFSLLSFLVALSVIFLIYPTMSAEAFNFALKSSSSNLAKAKLPALSDEFAEATNIMLAEADYPTYWYNIKPPAEAITMFKKGADKGCPYSTAALGYNLVRWEHKIDEGIDLLIQADAENCVYGSMLLSLIFWDPEEHNIYRITPEEATVYITQCLSRAIELQKYLDISVPRNRTIKEEVGWHLCMFANNFGGTGDRTMFIPTNSKLYEAYLKAARDIYKVVYPDDKQLLKAIDADIKNIPDYAFYTMTPLCHKYIENVVAADKLFKNKTVRFTASVAKIGKTDGFFSSIFILFTPPLDLSLLSTLMSDDLVTILATFKKSEEDKITEFYEGAEITIQGTVSGLNENTFILMTDCVIIAGGEDGD